MKLGLDRLPWYGQVGVFLLVAALGLLAFHAAWVVPARRAAALREQALDGRRNEIAAARQVERRRSALAAQVAALETRLGRVRTVPAAAHGSGTLLRRLQALAQASDLTLRAFTPQAPVAHALHEERPSRIELTGTFHGLARFLDRIGRLPRAVRISDLDLRARDRPGSAGTLDAACTVTTFAPEIVAPDGPAGVRRDPAYDPAGRRDPFAALPAGGGPRAAARPRGLAGVRIDELVLRGLVTAGRRRLAVLEAPAARTYLLQGTERLRDGVVQEVTRDAVVFLRAARGGSPRRREREVRMVLERAREAE